MNDITVVICAIPARRYTFLPKAIDSVIRQTIVPDNIVIAMDNKKEGAPYNRDRGLSMVNSKYVALLDDDDTFKPPHLELLLDCITENDADLVYPWFDVVGPSGLPEPGVKDPFPEFFEKPWDNANPHQVPITLMARTDALMGAGGFSFEWDETQGNDPGRDSEGFRAGEDYRMMLRLAKSDAKIIHLPKKTWRWCHHHSNTSGLPSRVK